MYRLLTTSFPVSFAVAFLAACVGCSPNDPPRELRSSARETNAVESPDNRSAQTTSAGVGTLKGRVRFTGSIPLATVPDQLGRKRELLQVHNRTKGVRDVLVLVRAIPKSSNKAEIEMDEAGEDPLVAESIVTIRQRDYAFIPQVVAIRVGTPIRFTNEDSSNHNVRSRGLGAENEFNRMVAQGGFLEHQYRVTGDKRPVVVGCDLHPWMQAWIYVFEQPFFSVTNDKGMFEIMNIPAGERTLRVLQPAVGLQRDVPVTIVAGGSSEIEIEFTNEDLSP